jgi:Ca2+-binding RTX toxin-like protein
MATINGTSGNDSLTGTSGNDTLNGIGGNDTLVGSGGTDFYDGGTGTDTLDLRATAAGITVNLADGMMSGGFNGTVANIERVLAGNGADNLIGGAGSQNLSGRTGNDTLAGAQGNDTLWGGGDADAFVFRQTGTANADAIADFASGSDRIVLDTVVMGTLGASGNFAAGDERFVANSSGTAQEADDRVIYETDTRQIWYDPDGTGVAPRELIATLQSSATLVATDIVVVGGGPVPIVGTDGNDSLTGTNGNDVIDGRGGNDTLRGLEGADSLRGGDGNDVLWSNDGPTTFANPDGAADTLDGGLGDDQYNVDGAEDVILADPGGIDLVLARGPSWTLGDGLDNLFLGTEAADGTGNALDNRIVSAWAGGTILGMGGNDTLQARGNDLVTVRGGDGDDTLLSSPTGGANLLVGDAGNDLLSGHIGPVTMTGGSGADTFLYDRDPTQFPEDDLITDFASSEDSIRLDGAAMPALGASGTFASNDARFAANPTGTAQDSSDRVVYNTTTGDLWYDEDGTGQAAAARLFTLQGAPLLAATDIEVVNGIAGWPMITGTEGDDTLIGTNRNDTIDGLGGNDSLRGNDGADLMVGGDGNDTLSAWFDDSGDRFADTLDGGLGDDVYFVNDDGDMILADPGGVDTVHIDNGNWTLGDGLENLDVHDSTGGPGNGVGNELDNIMRFGTSFQGMGGNDLLITAAPESSTSAHGGDGNDTLVGGGFRSSLFGDAGDDVLDPGSNEFFPFDENQLTGGAGADSFVFDEALGASANRILDFTSGADEIVLDGNAHPNIGASGRFAAGDARFAANSTGTAQDLSDRVIYNTANGDLWYDANGSADGGAALIVTLQGAPTFAATDIEVVNGTAPSGNVINGTAGNDTLSGTAGDDTINGLGGNDLFLAGSTGGADVIDGGAGRDSIEFKERATSPIQVDFMVGTITGGSSGTIEFTNIERVVTGNFHDDLTGDAGSQTLTGQGGADTLWGAGGADTLWGGSGVDNFLFREMGTANADRISDFASGSENLWLDDVAFTTIGPDGRFAAGDARFKANSSGTATDMNDRVVFNTSTGQLYYDADGSGSGAAALIATVQAGAAVAATDIVVI